MKRICLWIMAVAIPGLALQAAQEPLLLALGAHGGMRGVGGERVWTLGLMAEAGPSEGLQVRLGVELGVLGPVGLTQLETLVLLNLRFGARVHLGGGIGVAWMADTAQTQMQFPLLALAGLKTRPIGPWSFAIEGMLLIPTSFQEGFTTCFSAGVLFSL